MNKIIFLDFDGTMIPTTFSLYMNQMEKLSKKNVLTTDDFGEFFAPHCVENLKILVEKTNAKIVFTTRWSDQGYDNLIEMWKSRYNFGEIIGYAPTLINSIRGEQIKRWLDIHEDYDKYVILDDMTDSQFYMDQLENLVICDEKLGFTKKELEKALIILK